MRHDLRNVLAGATMRMLHAVGDLGEVIAGFISNIDGGSNYEIASDKSDVHVHCRESKVDAVNTDGGRPIKGRLFVPLDIMWRLPKGGESVTVLRPADADGPGVALILFGDGGPNAPQVPSWLDGSNCGISAPEALHLESTGDQVLIKSNTGGTVATITLTKQGGIVLTPTTGQTIQLGGSAHPGPLWDTFQTSLTTWVTAMQTMINALVVPTGILAPAQTTAATACGTLIGLLNGGTFNSQIIKNG